MDQIRERFTVEQVKVLLQSYLQHTISRTEVEEILQINQTRFFSLLKEYRPDPRTFSITYKRATPARLSAKSRRDDRHRAAAGESAGGRPGTADLRLQPRRNHIWQAVRLIQLVNEFPFFYRQ